MALGFCRNRSAWERWGCRCLGFRYWGSVLYTYMDGCVAFELGCLYREELSFGTGWTLVVYILISVLGASPNTDRRSFNSQSHSYNSFPESTGFNPSAPSSVPTATSLHSSLGFSTSSLRTTKSALLAGSLSSIY